MKTQTANKSRVNITVSPHLLEVYNKLEPVHGYVSLSAYVEDKIMDLIKEHAPDIALEMKIKEYEAKVIEMKENLPAVRHAAKQVRESKLKEKPKGKSTGVNEDIEKKRQETLEKYIPSLVYQIENRRKHDWDALQKDLGFRSLIETQDYVNGELESRGVI